MQYHVANTMFYEIYILKTKGFYITPRCLWQDISWIQGIFFNAITHFFFNGCKTYNNQKKEKDKLKKEV